MATEGKSKPGKSKAGKPKEPTMFATNGKAQQDDTILEIREAGLSLKGTEIKSIRQHQVNLDDSLNRLSLESA